MRELRTCPVEGHTVLLNDAWLERPPTLPTPPVRCPLCAPSGPTIRTAPGARGEAVRAVPHATPLLGVEGDARVRRGVDRVWRDGVGAHEVLYGVHGELDHPLLRLGAARVEDLRRDQRLRAFRLRRRVLPGRHVAWHLYALPFELGTSAPARWRARERQGPLEVAASAGAVALLAWAPRAPFETWVLPAEGGAAFTPDPAAGLLPVATLLEEVCARLFRALRAPLELVVVDGEPWRVEVRPTFPAAGIEVAAGIPAHGVFPERAAELLRALG